MTDVLYAIEFPFQAKTFVAIDPYVDEASAYLPLRPAAKDCTDEIEAVDTHFLDVGYVNQQVREIDPEVVVYNHHFRYREIDFHEEYPIVHARHGASIGRDTFRYDVPAVFPYMDVALAPGEMWVTQYREAGANLPVEVVGIPEADSFVGAAPPREQRVLYAPTNTRYGQGSFVNTADRVLDLFADTEFELLFRPHPHDVLEEPARSVARRCRDRICDLPNVVFDDNWSPVQSVRSADLLLSDYSGVVTEWLHTGRPFVQFTNVRSTEYRVPEVGLTTDDLDIETVRDLYENGFPDAVANRRDGWLEALGIPMDGKAGERAARAIVSRTNADRSGD